MTPKVSLEDLVKVGAHFGHQSRRWNPKMAEYIHGEQEGVHIFDLIKTKELLDTALAFLVKSVREGKTILFLGTKKQAKEVVKDVAGKSGVFYVTERWLGGTLTNFPQIKKSIKKLTQLKEDLIAGVYRDYTKKERVLLDREAQRLERFFGGLVGLDNTPDILVIIDIKREHAAVREALMRKVTTIAIVDSNVDPTDIDYPVPMNDDATKAISYVVNLLGEAIQEGKQKDSDTKKVKTPKSQESEGKSTKKASVKKVKKVTGEKKPTKSKK